MDQPRPYKLVHQLLCISNINFERQSYIGMIEMHIIAQRSDVRHFKLNCKQLRIFKILMNDFYTCQFTYNDPSLEICQEECKQRNIDSFSSSHFTCISSTDPEKNNGEIIVQIPTQLNSFVQEGRIIRVSIEFGAETPLGGIHFAVPRNTDDPDFNATATHLFTYGHENSSRLWFPSIDSYCEPCTWKLEFTVDASMIAVSSGDLLETVYTYDKRRKTYHYQLSVPTCAPAIGLAVGPFELMVDPNMHEVSHFGLPHLKSLLKDTCAFLHEAFEFYEELLSTRYPYTCYKQVFVDEAYQECQSYASFSILDVNLLHSRHIIDQTYKTREILTSAIAQQFFGTFITMHSYADAWLTRGLSSWLSSQYKRKAFGNNEYRFDVYENINEVIAYEQKHGGVILDPSKATDTLNNLYFSPKYFHTVSPLYDEIHRKKSYLIIRMLEDRIGRELMLQVFNKLLSLAINASQQKVTTNSPYAWSNMHLSTTSFTKAIFAVTGKDISNFLNQWVYIGGHPKFYGSFIFNRKRNIVELEIKQPETASLGIRKYMGPITVWIQELDGTFKHNLQVEENTTKHDITCHSKSRRNKKKKIPLCTGEEIDMDLSNMDSDSPVLWIRIDPDMQLLRQVVFEQPDINWQYQLRYERDVTAQAEAIHQLKKYPTNHTRKALSDIIENEHCYFKVRCSAAQALTHIANEMNSAGPPPMISTFKKLFGSHSCLNIPRLNNFSNFQNYFLQKAIPIACAGLRTSHKICPPEVLRFILDLFKYNDNTKNKFSDNYYRAALVEALATTVTPCVTAALTRSSSQAAASDALPRETQQILEEIVRYFNLDKLLPCYRHTVTVACLKAIRHLHKMGHLPSNSAFYKEYAQYGVFVDVRIQAIECLIDITKAEQRREDLDCLLDLIEFDPVPRVRFMTIKMMIDNPPITRKDIGNLLNSEEVVDRLWRLMNNSLSYDSKLRCAMVDLYYTFYGRGRPSCLPKPEFSMVFNLREKKAVLNTSSTNEPKQINNSSAPAVTPTPIRRERSESEERREAFEFLASLPKVSEDQPKVRRMSTESFKEDKSGPNEDEEMVTDDKIATDEAFVEPTNPSLEPREPSPLPRVSPIHMNMSTSLPAPKHSPEISMNMGLPESMSHHSPINVPVDDIQRSLLEAERKRDLESSSHTHSESSKKHKKKKKKKDKMHKHPHKEHKHKHKHKDKDKDKDKDRDRDRDRDREKKHMQ